MDSALTLRLQQQVAQTVGPEVRPVQRSTSIEKNLSNEELVARVQDGDREALALLFRRHARLVHSVVRRILRDEHEAEDVVQEIFIYVQRKAKLFDRSKGSAISWILQVAYTQALLRRRRLKAVGFYASAIADNPRECEFGGNPEAEYDQSVEGLFGRNGWRKILVTLTPDQRETLRLHFFEGYTFNEIAEKLGQSYANIRNHHYRALEKFRKHMEEDELKK